ncbi:MAG: gamma-glutamylcyclotransferase [Acidobacteria bacterium]|nr:gamma-glutamylcyclotransferase [Acidobacteriota bacterium]
MIRFLFVYGTLRPEFAPAEIIGAVRKLKFVGEGTIAGALYDLGPYPAARLGGSGKIRGRVYELPADESVLRRLDEYEAFDPKDPAGSLYVRRAAAIDLPGKTLTGWVYEYNPDLTDARRILDGDYPAYRNKQR